MTSDVMCALAPVSKIHSIIFFAFSVVISADYITTVSAPVVVSYSTSGQSFLNFPVFPSLSAPVAPLAFPGKIFPCTAVGLFLTSVRRLLTTIRLHAVVALSPVASYITILIFYWLLFPLREYGARRLTRLHS